MISVDALKRAPAWVPSLLRSTLLRRQEACAGETHIYFCVADHFEPGWHGADLDRQRERVRIWAERYPQIAARHCDSEGHPPQHTFFFPAEEYHPELLDALAVLCRGGWGDVEIHLHHDRDTPEGFREKLLRFADVLHHRHGLLRKDNSGRIRYGFIHGNWVLNNSGPDGRWCGVDDETSILLETGCYADFTMPCAPHPAQSRKVNSIYYTLPQRAPGAHNRGVDAHVGRPAPPGLLMVQGPLSLDWSCRKWGIFPRIESADISSYNPPDRRRVLLWLRSAVHVAGAPQHVFIKLHTHGAQEPNSQLLLRGGLQAMWRDLEHLCPQGGQYRLHYLTAYQMFLKIKALENDAAFVAGIYPKSALRGLQTTP